MNKFISEAVKIDDNVKTKLGERLIELFGLIGKNKSIEFTLMSGTKVVLRCIKAAEPKFDFEILLDDEKLLCKWDTLQLTLKMGNKNDKNPIGKYNLNPNTIKPSEKKDDAFNLVFDSSNDKGEKNKYFFNNIVSIEPSTLAEKKTKCGEVEPEKQQDAEAKDEVNSIDPKALYDSIVNDPVMKTAFYKQPSLWNYLVAIVKGEKPRGSGLVSAADIVSDYRQSKIGKEIGPDFDNFVFNEELTYKILSPEKIVFDSVKAGNPQIEFKNNIDYTAKVLPISFDDERLKLEDEKAGVSIIIRSKNKKERTEYPFDVLFIKKYDNGEETKYNAVIDIKNVKGSGFYKKEAENNN
jgi:hypothetical protein